MLALPAKHPCAGGAAAMLSSPRVDPGGAAVMGNSRGFIALRDALPASRRPREFRQEELRP